MILHRLNRTCSRNYFLMIFQIPAAIAGAVG